MNCQEAKKTHERVFKVIRVHCVRFTHSHFETNFPPQVYLEDIPLTSDSAEADVAKLTSLLYESQQHEKVFFLSQPAT